MAPWRLSPAHRWRAFATALAGTLLSNTYCAGRQSPSEISGAIGPSVLTPRRLIISVSSGCPRYRGHAKFFPLWAMARYRNSPARQCACGGLRDVARGSWGGRELGFQEIVAAATRLSLGAVLEPKSDPNGGFGISCNSISPRGTKVLKSKILPMPPQVISLPEAKKVPTFSPSFRTWASTNASMRCTARSIRSSAFRRKK